MSYIELLNIGYIYTFKILGLITMNFIILMLIQLLFYRIFKINLYKKIVKYINKQINK